jgi:parallel beta-helix repeat protein
MVGRRRLSVLWPAAIVLVTVLALFAFVATTEERAEASDVAPVQGELMDTQLTGTSVVNDPMYQEGKALKFSSIGATATHTVTFGADSGLHDVVLLARAGQSGGSPRLTVSVNGTPKATQDITNSGAPEPYTFVVNAPSGPVEIGVRADNTATGRNAFVDVLSFPSSGGSTTPPPPSDWPYSDCEKEIKPVQGVDIDNIINSDPSGTATTFCVYAGTYTVSTQATLKAGDKLKGEPGPPPTSVGPAKQPEPVVMLKGSGSDNLLRADGNGIYISWVDLTGASGTGNGTGAIAAGSAGSDFLVEYSRIHENDSLGISNMNGTVRYSEFFKNSIAQSALGFNGSAVKGITEYEADGVYVHEEQGNGLWCDVGCKNSARNMTDACPTESTGCFWVHNSVVENSGRAGIRYENSSSEALFENNVIRGNAINEHRGGIDIRDSQDAEVRNNILSANNGIGVRATDSGRSDRVNLERILVKENDLGGDRIVTCGGPVQCINNTNVGTR